jgi:hypothetical protein
MSFTEPMKRSAVIFLLVLLAIAGVSYALDYGLLRLRVARNRSPFGTVNVRRYYAVQKKNGKTEFMFNPPQDEQCVHSAFSHMGYLPCWRLARHPEQRIDI